MKIGYFTERPYRWVAEDDVLQNHAGTTRLPVVDRSPLDSLGLSF